MHIIVDAFAAILPSHVIWIRRLLGGVNYWSISLTFAFGRLLDII